MMALKSYDVWTRGNRLNTKEIVSAKSRDAAIRAYAESRGVETGACMAIFVTHQDVPLYLVDAAKRCYIQVIIGDDTRWIILPKKETRELLKCGWSANADADLDDNGNLWIT